ncbi:type II secretion system major pseudopilin GspG [Pseudidiomarina terrestris]|uniref:Type II secretion system core protein G n=1 Tax=Pseudidiomarina terrestris TaxID=2820060 RepID=A0AAW7QW74_9GAMM|nr:MULTISPECIES: type II secretion system major pseudopilin GspG [unclassified Pseudidiomarina]MDN7124447.1 type II secretion system major pseudopilin GspG [Pseudidiomarina sp. 1APP75-32.1]MDN7126998.1 type II secretion system major pseudopilin GspG [Pseudidiomarina sp. 1APR75-33.1]MDN7129262.1 type II secretion system major pseudopilin GspG [Pseudidiomarina sp. 1APR75-15]MDN7134472.1 type II secretion system major pseudopilin GspG [Pseudidiomarina sp. 1ASP75-5]MEA3587733.1 type II secretion s
MQKTKGFSLIEVMVVIVILGLLATMILPNVLGSAEQANRQKVKSDIVALENALSQYKLDNGMFPTTEQGLEALLNEPTTEPTPRNYRRGGYIQRLPQDPYGSDYLLLSPGEYSDIDIFSAGEDRQPGTEDDIGNWNLEQN